MTPTEIANLTESSNLWEAISTLATVLVFVGVSIESVADFDSMARWVRLAQNEERRKFVAKLGLLVLLIALALEIPSGIYLHKINAELTNNLNSRLADTVEHEIELTKLTNTLGTSNTALEKKVHDQHLLLSSISSRNDKFETAINEQKRKNTDAIKALKDEELKLTIARKDAQLHAKESSLAAESAKKVASDMNKTLAAEQQMQQAMREVITPRNLSQVQIDTLTNQLRPYASTVFDLGVALDPDSTHVLEQIATALEKAGWVWKEAPEIGAIQWTITGKPQASISQSRGVSIDIAQSSAEKLKPAAEALAQGLLKLGIRACVQVYADAKINEKYDKQRIHVFVGIRG